MIGQMKHILAAEQKKTDFKPEDENNVLIQYTNVSNQSVTKYKMLLIQLPLYNMCIYLMTSILHQAPPNSVVDCFLKLKRNMSIFYLVSDTNQWVLVELAHSFSLPRGPNLK